MAINKKLIHFNKKEKFEYELAKGNIMPTSIVFIKDAQKIWTHGLYYSSLEDYYTKKESDNKYLTEHQSLDSYYTKAETLEQVNNYVKKLRKYNSITLGDIENISTESIKSIDIGDLESLTYLPLYLITELLTDLNVTIKTGYPLTCNLMLNLNLHMNTDGSFTEGPLNYVYNIYSDSQERSIVLMMGTSEIEHLFGDTSFKKFGDYSIALIQTNK